MGFRGMVYAVLGNSQAMKAAWVEDLLSFLPPISFLLAARVIRKRPSGLEGPGHRDRPGGGTSLGVPAGRVLRRRALRRAATVQGNETHPRHDWHMQVSRAG